MYLCKELTTHSLPTIARAFDGRDHTTVLYALQTRGNPHCTVPAGLPRHRGPHNHLDPRPSDSRLHTLCTGQTTALSPWHASMRSNPHVHRPYY